VSAAITKSSRHDFVLRDEVVVKAPIERCFLLSTSLAIVQRELGVRPVEGRHGGRTSGLVVAGDTVLWRGWQFGLPQFHQSLIEHFDPPRFFRDRMIAGRFASFEHDHRFTDQGDGTMLLADELRFTMPFGWLGALASRWVLAPHIRKLMRRRFLLLKCLAEGEEWRRYLETSS
jgi:ligand-binding SRPBCC domain-containing protein